MKGKMVDVTQIRLPLKLKDEIQHCYLCQVARQCMAFCCPKHLRKIERYIRGVEKGLWQQ